MVLLLVFPFLFRIAPTIAEIQVGPDFSAHSIPADAQTLLDLLAQTLEEGGNWSGK